MSKTYKNSKPRARGSQINFRIDPDMKQRAKVCAAINNKNLEEWCNIVLKEAVDAQLKGIKLPFNLPVAPFNAVSAYGV